MTYSCFLFTALLWPGPRLMSHGTGLSFHAGKKVLMSGDVPSSVLQTDTSCLNCSTGQPPAQGLSLDDMRRTFQYPAVDKNGELLQSAPRARLLCWQRGAGLGALCQLQGPPLLLQATCPTP